MDQTKGPNPQMLKNYNPKIISLVCAPPVLSSHALVQLNHSAVLMQIIALVRGKEAVLVTLVMQLEYHGYC